ncbi:MAG TPA: sigma-54 dependent transcriptional regulator [Candidatus Eisenbacteria bacterium]|nr:sigma-54 dependent transcriptional regulator [Candidatus Eisenbacteria bacterium]
MRIVLVGVERGDALVATVTRAQPGARLDVVDTSTALANAPDPVVDLVLLGPAAVAREDAVRGVRALRAAWPGVPIVALGRADDAVVAVALLKAGATDYLVADGDPELLQATLGALAAIPAPREPDAPVPGLIGRTRAMAEVRALVRVAARAEAHVLVEGETGTGKEVVARAIHGLGRRAARPFVPINCAAVPESLAESEFFGHARGAFTGAIQERPGALRLADGGTLFLDEIEDLPLSLQAKLLRVVQDGEVRPLGASVARRLDVRLIAASNQDLWRMVESGRFRSDLFYRLRVLTLRLPPLRERRADIPLLVAHFVERFNGRQRTTFASPSEHACRPLLEHPWPGNVRELENALEALLTLAQATGADLVTLLQRQPAGSGSPWADERTRILRVLEANRWNRQRAASALGISRVTLWRRMERHGIRDPLGGTRETA